MKKTQFIEGMLFPNHFGILINIDDVSMIHEMETDVDKEGIKTELFKVILKSNPKNEIILIGSIDSVGSNFLIKNIELI